MDSSVVIVAVLLGLVLLRLLLVAVGAALIVRPVIDCPACFGPSFGLHRHWLEWFVQWIEWRWCPRCGWQGPARRVPEAVRRDLARQPEPHPHPLDGTANPWA